MHHQHGINQTPLKQHHQHTHSTLCWGQHQEHVPRDSSQLLEYMRMPISLFPTNIINHYQLNNKVLKDYVYMEIRKVMCGLPQASILANKLLKKRLAKHGYFEQPHTPGLFSHESHPIWFNLAVDNFRIKYIGEGTV
jgi:hypothetical protein